MGVDNSITSKANPKSQNTAYNGFNSHAYSDTNHEFVIIGSRVSIIIHQIYDSNSKGGYSKDCQNCIEVFGPTLWNTKKRFNKAGKLNPNKNPVARIKVKNVREYICHIPRLCNKISTKTIKLKIPRTILIIHNGMRWNTPVLELVVACVLDTVCRVTIGIF